MQEAIIICRRTSRHGMAYLERVQEELTRRNVSMARTFLVRRRKRLKRCLRKAVKSGRRLVVVIGGDGTQTTAAGVLAHTECVLGVIPAGTGNSFALSLGIEPNLDDAIEAVVRGKELLVDLGTVNGIYFANVASIGVPAAAAKATPRVLKKLLGMAAYGVASVAPLFFRRPFTLRIRQPGRDFKIKTHHAIVANGRYFGLQPLAPDASVRSGELTLYTAGSRSPAKAVAVAIALLVGKHRQLPGARVFSADRFRVTAKPRQPLDIDGHAAGETPALFSVAPRALRVLVPHSEAPREDGQ